MKQVKANHIEEIAKLVKRAKKGDKKAFQLLYQNTWKPIYYMLLKKIGNESDAEVLLNEVFINVFVSIKSLENEMLFISWVTTIANNVYYGFLRKNERKELEELYSDSEHIKNEEEYNDDFLPDAALEKKENRALIIKAIDGLPEKQCEAIYMFYYLNMKTKEIAVATNTTEKAVTKRLHDAKKSLKNKLGELVRKGVIVYNMAGFIVLRELFQEDMLNTVNEKIGVRGWIKVSSDAAVRLAQKNAASNAIKSLAVKFTASAAVAGVAAIALWQVMGTKEIHVFPIEVMDKYAVNQPDTPKEIESSEDIEPFAQIYPTEIPLATTARSEEESIVSENISQETPIASEIVSEATPIPANTEEVSESALSEILTPIETATAKGSVSSLQTSVNIEEYPTTKVIEPITVAMELTLVYEINEGPDEAGLVKDIAFYSSGVFEPNTVKVLSNEFDRSRVGNYIVQLIGEADENALNIKAAIQVVDTISPKIFIENMYLRFQSGEAVSLEEITRIAGITVEDNSFEEIAPTVIGYESINFFLPFKREYMLIVNARDSAGNAALQEHISVIIE